MEHYKKRIYEFSTDEICCYDLFLVSEDDEEEYIDRFFCSTIQEMIDIVAGSNPYELEDDPCFEDWYHIYINEDIHYRIQLFR